MTLAPRDWAEVSAGRPFRVRSQGFYEGTSFSIYWSFAGGLDGRLRVEYGNDGGVGFDGLLSDATVEPTTPVASSTEKPKR